MAKRKSASSRNQVKSAGEPESAAIPDRHRRIKERAYYKAEQRDFSPGMELQDWLEAEAEIEDT